MFCEDANYVLFRFPCGCRWFRWSASKPEIKRTMGRPFPTSQLP